MNTTTIQEQLTFLKELQQELNTQENDGQAAPRFWSILNYRYVPAHPGSHDQVVLYFSDQTQTIALDVYVDMLLHHFKAENEEMMEALQELNELWTDSFSHEEDILEWIKEHQTEEVDMFYEKLESFVAPDTLFLTKEEAQNHLKNNHYHYQPLQNHKFYKKL